MSKIRINKVKQSERETPPQLSELEKIGDDVRARAYELFQRRGFGDGHAVDDWLRAEREICWPAAELQDKGKRFRLRIALAGFDDEDIEVTATPRALVVKAERESEKKGKDDTTVWSEFRSNSIVRRVPMPAEIDVAEVTARYKRGLLTIDAPKAGDRKADKQESPDAKGKKSNP